MDKVILAENTRELTPEEVAAMMEQIKRFNEETFSILEDEYKRKGKVTSPTIERVMIRVGSNERYELFQHIEINYPMTSAAYRYAFRDAWTTDRVPEDNAIYYFEGIGLNRMLNAKERKLYDSLPKTITIYRGCHKNEAEPVWKYRGKFYPDFHLSWTLNRDVAEFFAFRGKHFAKEDGRVYSIRIKKDQMLALFLDRSEYEVIYPYSYGGKYKPFNLVTDKPTEYFIRYMESKDNY